jgi:NitT/TauT family transport system substrate-binding protein
MSYRRLLTVCFLVFLAACSPQTTAPPTKTNAPVSIQLSWVHEYSSAAFYAAEKNGHFAERGLQVELREGGFKDGKYIVPIDEVVEGKEDFGLSDSESLILARSQGKPVVAIASILQRSPFALISLADKNIRTPKDLIGKKVSVSDGGATQIYNTLLATQKIDQSKVNFVPRTSFGVDPLLNGDVDVLGGWIINEGVQIKEAGKEPSFLLMSDYGVDTYDFVVFTTEKMIQERPELVQAMVASIVDGMKDVIANPAQAAEYAVAYGKDLKLDGQRRRVEASIPLMNPAGTKPGNMSAETWTLTQQILLDQKVLDKPIDLTKVYTLTFLDKVYAAKS